MFRGLADLYVWVGCQIAPRRTLEMLRWTRATLVTSAVAVLAVAPRVTTRLLAEHLRPARVGIT
jgi:hypothetical protein